MRRLLIAATVSLLVFIGLASEVSSKKIQTQVDVSTLRPLPAQLEQLSAPTINEPDWLADKKAAEAAAAAAAARPARQNAQTGRAFTYSVESWGNTTVSIDEFRSQAAGTLTDGRGWAKAGVSFQEVASGGQFILVISEASELARRYSPGCSAEYSCRVGPYVIINQDRWTGATPSWNQAGGSLRDYRHMVINHEVGHWLGHGHANCPAAGQLAPVMLQQSIDLQGCRFNPWPLGSESWVGR